MDLFLVPAGRNRFELYSETLEEPDEAPGDRDVVFRQWAHGAAVRWRALVDASRRGTGGGRVARWRDGLVCHLADSISEGRTLWALRAAHAAVVHVPSTLESARVRAIMMSLLGQARRRHLRWSLIDLVLLIASGPFALVPGPNMLAYYLAFRLVGHIQGWRGARQGMERVTWSFEPDTGLAELQMLVDVPRAERAPRVAAIAADLKLPRLSAFFDRVAIPSV